jgi:hypothetical protein
MQSKLEFNLHGAVGIAFIMLMFGIAFFLNWNVNWWYFSIAILLYSVAVILFTNTGEVRWVLGCHLTLLFWAVGLLLHFQDYIPRDVFGITWVYPAGLVEAGYFIVSIVGGLAIPFLLLKFFHGGNIINLHGLIALLLIILLFGVAFFYNWSFNHLYQLYFLAAMLYAGACILMGPDFWSSHDGSDPLPPPVRPQLGCHLAFIFLIVGFGLHFKDGASIIGFFIASIAIGLAIPYLLFRGSSGGSAT